MKLASVIAVLVLGFSGSLMAAPMAIDQQVDAFFARGMEHCKQAMDLSRTSAKVAAAEFDRYTSYMRKVEALKPELKSDIMISRQMAQCEQVGHDIARIQALPVIEEGLVVCGEVKSLVNGDYLSKAKARFLEYTRHRDQALAMTDTVLKVGFNASKIRRCDRLEEKIIAAEQRIHHSEIKADRLLSALRKSTDSCEVTRNLLEDGKVTEDKLMAAESMLSQARDYFKQTERYPDAVTRAENFPGYASSQKIRQYLMEYSRCDQHVAANLAQQHQLLVQQQAAEPAQSLKVMQVADNRVEHQAAEPTSEANEASGLAQERGFGAELVQMVYDLE